MWEFIADKILDLVAFILKRSRQKGIIAEWMEPEWFKFAGGSYSNLIPREIEIWLQVYFRNTTEDPHILQSVKGEFTRETKFWSGYFSGVQPDFNTAASIKFPKTILPKDSLPAYLRFVFPVAAQSPDDFIAQVKASPDLLFKIIYHTKEGAKTQEKFIERSLKFKDLYKGVYVSFLSGVPNPDASRLIKLLE